MNAKREIFRCFLHRRQMQKVILDSKWKFIATGMCVVMSFTLLLFNDEDPTGRLVPANTIYVPTYNKIIIIHFYCYHNCKRQCQRVEQAKHPCESWTAISIEMKSFHIIIQVRALPFSAFCQCWRFDCAKSSVGYVERASVRVPVPVHCYKYVYLFCYESMDAIQPAAYKNTIKFVFYYCRDPIRSHSTTRHKENGCVEEDRRKT